MNTLRITSLLTLLIAGVAQSSTLSLTFEHDVAVAVEGTTRKVLRTRFTEDPLIADVKLNVYAVPEMPWTAERLDDLRRLDDKTWWHRLTWTVVDEKASQREVKPRLIRSSMRNRGPHAARSEDRDTAFDCLTFQGSFDLGMLPPGDYTIRVAVYELEAQYPLALRTGREEEVRDVYLRKKAAGATDWLQIKALHQERIERDPTKADALLALAHGSIEHGTLQEVQQYLDRAVATMEKNMTQWAKVNPADAKRQAPGFTASVRRIRALQRVLPDFFAHRRQWRLTADASGAYVITSRDTNKVLKRIQ